MSLDANLQEGGPAIYLRRLLFWKTTKIFKRCQRLISNVTNVMEGILWNTSEIR